MPKAKPSKKSSAKKSNIFVRAINKFSSMHKPAQVMVLALVFGLIGGGGYAVYSSFAATPSSQAIGNGYLINATYNDSAGNPLGYTYLDPFTGNIVKAQLKDSQNNILTGRPTGEIQWSPTSYKFLLEDNTGPEMKVYVAEYNGTNAKQVYSSANNVMSLRWSPDGTKIALLDEKYNAEQWSWETKLKIVDLNGTILHEVQLPTKTTLLAWNASGSKIFTGINDPNLTTTTVGHEYSLTTKTINPILYNGLNGSVTRPIAYLNDSELVYTNYDSATKSVYRFNLSTSTNTPLGTLPNTYSEQISNNRTWIIGTTGYDDLSTIKLINVNGTSKDIKPSGCANASSLAMFSPDSKKILFGCTNGYTVEKSYDIATGAIANLPKPFSMTSTGAAWQPGVKRTSSKTCTSGSYTMKSDLTFYGLSSGKRVMNPLVMTPQISGKTQSKKIEYKITVQTLKDGVWTTKQVIGPTTASTTGAVTLNPVDQLEYSIVGTKVIVSSGVAGDSAGNCSVTHYSS